MGKRSLSKPAIIAKTRAPPSADQSADARARPRTVRRVKNAHVFYRTPISGTMAGLRTMLPVT
jgi:hypothetical protein